MSQPIWIFGGRVIPAKTVMIEKRLTTRFCRWPFYLKRRIQTEYSLSAYLHANVRGTLILPTHLISRNQFRFSNTLKHCRLDTTNEGLNRRENLNRKFTFGGNNGRLKEKNTFLRYNLLNYLNKIENDATLFGYFFNSFLIAIPIFSIVNGFFIY